MGNNTRYRSVLALTALCAVGGAIIALCGGAALSIGQRRTAADQLDRRASLVAENVTAQARRYADTLQTVAAASGAFPTLTADAFARATESLPAMNLAGATSIAFVAPAEEDQVAAVQATWRARGVPQLTLKPVGTGKEHLFAIFSTRLDSTRSSGTGVDVSQLAAPTAALYEARRSGTVTVSDAYELLRDRQLPAAQRQKSFVLSAPVYSAGPGGRTFRGWVLMGMRGQEFIGATLRTASQGLLDVTLLARNADQATVPVAHLTAAEHDGLDLVRTVSASVANRSWRLTVRADALRLPGGSTGLPTAITLSGIALSSLLAGLIYVLGTGRARAEARVLEATAELRAAESEASRQADLLSAILDGISDGVGVVNADGEFLLHNPAARTMLGIDDDRDGAEHWQEHYGLFRADGTTEYPTEELPMVLALAGEHIEQVEMLVRNANQPDGLVISVSARPLDTGSGRSGAVAVFHDITRRKQAEGDLKGFAGIVAHDLKSPLTAVRGYAELAVHTLEGRLEDRDVADAHRSIAKVLAAAERMERLITDLLDLTMARHAPLTTAALDLRAVVDDVVATRIDDPTHALDGERRRPDIYVGALPAVQGDPVLVRQVMDNLVGNALKYTPPGQLPRVDITAGQDGHGWVRVEVADRGIGIPEGQHAVIFDSFHRAHNGYTGTGLGLAICKRIVERHGGRITVSDNPGGGALFALTLPAAVPATVPAQPVLPDLRPL